MSAGSTSEGRTSIVVAVGAEHVEAFVAESQLGRGDHNAHVRLGGEHRHHTFGSIVLLRILLDRIDIATCVEGTSHITTCAETSDSDIVARAQDLFTTNNSEVYPSQLIFRFFFF